ncbi:Serine/Threonine-kinase WNK2-like protein [Medicago truncatula]|uniref:non-specific serine/threonine protein kinase n=1 Tax=Medicago truncatula TaxID=3880 RepID=A0A072V6A8_MEDTR|nr:Serine/Threonine-kinase WNK2-like protein [Medicago truncatula]
MGYELMVDVSMLKLELKLTLKRIFERLFMIIDVGFLTKEIASGMLYIFLKMLPIKSWARQMLEGLVYLHEHDPRVIHRNLKRDIVFVNGRL